MRRRWVRTGAGDDRRGVFERQVQASGAEQTLISETVVDDGGRDLYERVAQYANRKTRFRIWLDRPTRAISGWVVEVP
jgi:hypothetical protein